MGEIGYDRYLSQQIREEKWGSVSFCRPNRRRHLLLRFRCDFGQLFQRDLMLANPAGQEVAFDLPLLDWAGCAIEPPCPFSTANVGRRFLALLSCIPVCH